jgi:AraC family L-rhamnose operon regulatory protein RhaS
MGKALHNRRPIFHESGHTYVADTCDPLIRAVEKRQVVFQALARGHYPGRKLPSDALSGVKTVGFWDAEHAQDWGLDWHRNEGIELTLLESGRLPYNVDSHEVTLKPGDLTIARPWQLHRVGNPHIPAGRLHWLILDVDVRRPHQSWKWPAWLVLSKSDLKELTNIIRHNEQPVWRAPRELRRTFERVGRFVETEAESRNISRLTVCLNELFMEILEMCRQSNVPLDASLSGSCRTVELFLADLASRLNFLAQEWTVPRMAKECGLGTTQFVRHCKQITNSTPLQYLNESRLDAARRILVEQPDRSVTNIALDCGFSSSQYFATVFRQRFGIAPNEVRRNDTEE